ncbi:hypothetical protein DRH27_05710 [Candidatus Falkowbacteria bacterium]|nr:MAG: hypothetical protein DRH27_05710 [Candidatus Falkowbacteria bacterium]
MTKKTIFYLILVVSLSIALTGCSLFNKEKTDLGANDAAQQGGQKEAQEEIEDFQGSMQDLISKGKPVKCTYSGETESGDSFSGIIYVADKKARQDAEGNGEGKVTEIHTIVEDRLAYFWTSENPNKGFKIDITQAEEELKEFGEDFNEASEQEWQKDFSYKCSKWKVDKSKFELPSDVDFMDMSEMMNRAGNMFGEMDEELPNREIEEGDLPILPEGPEGFDMDEMKKSMCAMCDNAPDIEECKAGLGCE